MNNLTEYNSSESSDKEELNLQAMQQVKKHYDKSVALIDLILKDTSTDENIRNN
jgi:hypothetical protein